MPILLAALSALLFGSADFAGGYAARRNPLLPVLIVSQAAGAMVALAAALLAGAASPGRADLLWGVAAGLSGTVGLLALYRGIAATPVAVVSPVSALAGALTPMGFGLLLGEAPSAAARAGAALCLPATVLLSLPQPDPHGPGRPEARAAVRRALLLGLAAGAGFGGFFIAVSRPPAGAGFWPLVAARLTSVTAALLACALTGRRPAVAARDLGIVLAAGVFDMGANIAFVLAARSGLLILVTVVAAMYPAPTVLLARLVLRQGLGPARAAGLALAIAGVALIGVG